MCDSIDKFKKSWKDAAAWTKQTGFPIAQAAALPTIKIQNPRMHDYD